MKKRIISIAFMALVLAGCGAASTEHRYTDQYTVKTEAADAWLFTSASSEGTENNTEKTEETSITNGEDKVTETQGVITEITSDENMTTVSELQTLPDSGTEAVTLPSNQENEGGDSFAYKIHDMVMDFDSVEGPYIIINMQDMSVLECSKGSAKVVSYSYEGSILTITIYSDEHPVNETYIIDTDISAVGTLPVS